MFVLIGECKETSSTSLQAVLAMSSSPLLYSTGCPFWSINSSTISLAIESTPNLGWSLERIWMPRTSVYFLKSISIIGSASLLSARKVRKSMLPESLVSTSEPFRESKIGSRDVGRSCRSRVESDRRGSCHCAFLVPVHTR